MTKDISGKVKKMVADHLGVEEKFFAYPYGEFDDET